MDTDSGELIACDKQGCVEVLGPDRVKTAEALGLKQRPATNDTQPKLDQPR